MIRALLLLLLAASATGCAFDRDITTVACEDDSHCPAGWWCPGTPEQPATCDEGMRPDDDDITADDDDTVSDDDDTVADDDDTDLDDDDTAVDDDDTILDDDDTS